MQYSQDKKKNTTSFYGIIAVCLIAIALTTYIAVSKNAAEDDKIKNNEDSVISNDESSYNENITQPAEETAPTENKAEDVPYDKPQESAETETVKKDEPKTFVLPVKGKIIKQYSDDTLQYDKTFGDMRLHKAIDIACSENSQIVSAAAGSVTDVRDSAEFGKIVTIDHGNGYTVEYCGLGTAAVTKGESVGAGILIGTAKNPPCECLDECHIHIVCLKDGVPFDPLTLYSQNK